MDHAAENRSVLSGSCSSCTPGPLRPSIDADPITSRRDRACGTRPRKIIFHRTRTGFVILSELCGVHAYLLFVHHAIGCM
jgi:hypothetical protein